MTVLREKIIQKFLIQEKGKEVEVKGIVCEVGTNFVDVIPFDATSANSNKRRISLSAIVSHANARLKSDDSELLRQAYEEDKQIRELEERIRKGKELIRQQEATLRDKKRRYGGTIERLNLKRFDTFGNAEAIALKLEKDLSEAEAFCIYQPGANRKCVRTTNVQAVGKQVQLVICFENEQFGDNFDELYWLDYERYYDCSDWKAFQQKHCPNMKTAIKQVFPMAKMVKEERDCGRGEEKRRVPLETTYTLAFAINKDNYADMKLQIVKGLKSFLSSYVTNRNY